MSQAGRLAAALLLLFFAVTAACGGQTSGSHGAILGSVTDPSGAVVPGATVTIRNLVSGFSRQAVSDGAGRFQFLNLPLNPYHLSATAAGFQAFVEDLDVRSPVPVEATVVLAVGAAATSVTVENAGDLLESDPTFHTDLDRGLLGRLPLESQSSALSSMVTLGTPGVAADSNGLFHGLGDHASNSFSIDGQPVTDQQSKVFSNQLPSNAVQSMEVISGAPPAEYGGKTSLVIDVTTRSGLGATEPHGSLSASWGSFGTATGSFDVSYGDARRGNFFEADGLDSGRFLDSPEFAVFHDRGNEQNLFDRLDLVLSPRDSLHLNLNYSRSWFETPNAYDNLSVHDSAGNDVGNADQRSKIETYDIAPVYTRIAGVHGLWNLGAYLRRDGFSYFPSSDPLADLGPLQQESVAQYRTLTNAGLRSDYSYAKGANTLKAGVVYQHTFLRERDTLGIVDPILNAPCLDAGLKPLPGFRDPAECAAAGELPNDGSLPAARAAPFRPSLLAYDLTRGGGFYPYRGRADVKELGLYVQDQIKAGRWLLNLGLRGDLYNGLAAASQAEPRLGAAYTLGRTGTVLRASYARTLETPFNENLVLSSKGCSDAVLNPLLACAPGVSGTLEPGFKNEFHAGLEQAFGRYLVVSAEYIWKYTHNAFDFSVLGNTPITFPIDWHNAKIPGFMLRADVPLYRNFTAFVTMSSVAARFFPPQTAGAGATPGNQGYPFRIDHDERFNQTTHLQYQLPAPGGRGPWIGFNWRYDSGMVAGRVPCYNVTDANSGCNPANGGPSITLPGGVAGIDLSGLTADQQAQAGLSCDGVRATPAAGFLDCDAAGLGSNLVRIPAPGTENDDRNPPRIAPRHLFDLSVGEDNLFGGDRHRWSLRLTAVNLANQYALYNFLSTFSGTHFVAPRTITGELGFHF